MTLPKIERQIRKGLPLVGVPPYGQIHPHSTGNPKSTAQNEADYMGHKDINTGFYTHVVGNDRIIQVAEVGRGAYDVGGGWNQWTYAAVELIESHKTKAEFERDYKIYIELIRKLADEAGIPKKLDSGEIGINTHDYCRRKQPYNGTDHVDPYPYLAKWGISREQFKKDIENGIKSNESIKPSEPTNKRPRQKVETYWYGKESPKYKQVKKYLADKNLKHAEEVGTDGRIKIIVSSFNQDSDSKYKLEKYLSANDMNFIVDIA